MILRLGAALCVVLATGTSARAPAATSTATTAASTATPAATPTAAPTAPHSGAAAYLPDLQAALDALRAAPPRIEEARTKLASASTGAEHDGYLPDSSLSPVLADLAATPPDVADSTIRLQGMLNVLRPPAEPGSSRNAAAASGALARVYSSPTFRNLDAPPDNGWATRLATAMQDFFKRVLGSRSGSATGGPGAGIGAGTIAVAMLILLTVAIALWFVLRSRIRRASLIEPAGTTSDPDAEWTAALTAAAAADHREAIRRAFRSALLSVARQGRLPVDPAWTTRELLARASDDADLLAPLNPAAALFQHAWYSGRPVGENEWLAAHHECETIRGLATRARAHVP